MVDELLEAQRLATRLRRVRLERGLSLRGAATEIGVTKETLSDLERARRQPHPPTLAKIAAGYGVEISALLGPMVEKEAALAGEAEAPEAGPQEGLPESRITVDPERRKHLALLRQDIRALDVARVALEDVHGRWKRKVKENDFLPEELREAVNNRNAVERALGEKTNLTDILREHGEYENWRTDWPEFDRVAFATIVDSFWETRTELFKLLAHAFDVLRQRNLDEVHVKAVCAEIQAGLDEKNLTPA